jgi:hypothetical protein
LLMGIRPIHLNSLTVTPRRKLRTG